MNTHTTSIVKSLYQCQDLLNQIETDEGEVTQEQLQAIVSAHTQSIEKLKSLCGFLRYLEHGITACKAEKDRINQMQKTAEIRLERIKDYLTPFVKDKGTINIDTFSLSVRKSVAVELVPGFENPYFCKVVKELVPDKRAIREALTNQEEIAGARLVTNFNLQIM
jgi:hypothetical protein